MVGIGARLADEADNACAAAQVGGRRVLRFDADLLDGVFRNVQRGDDGGSVVFGDAQRAAVDHVVDRAYDRAVEGVRGNVNAGTSARDIGDGEGTGEFGAPLAGVTPGLTVRGRRHCA